VQQGNVTSPGHLWVLIGPSGTGKTSILRYMESTWGIDAAPKYTTRASRNTSDDEKDFIFCSQDTMPSGLLTFESYGSTFGIQLNRIADSLKSGRSHGVVLGDRITLDRLVTIFGEEKVIGVLVYCDTDELERRIRFSGRAWRWPRILEELSAFYPQLRPIRFVVDNTGDLSVTCNRVDRLIATIGKMQEA
jgi:ribose 1,5-bisphosphokinase PhnN